MLGVYTNNRDISHVSDMNARYYTKSRGMSHVSDMNDGRLNYQERHVTCDYMNVGDNNNKHVIC